eukprot:11804728-Alexandrium_andersonii.AAC.1
MPNQPVFRQPCTLTSCRGLIPPFESLPSCVRSGKPGPTPPQYACPIGTMPRTSRPLPWSATECPQLAPLRLPSW